MNEIFAQLGQNRAAFEAGGPASPGRGGGERERPREAKRPDWQEVARTPTPAPLPVRPGASDGRVHAFSLSYPPAAATRPAEADLTAGGSVEFPSERALGGTVSAEDPVDGLVRRLEAQARLKSQLLGEEDAT